MSWRASSTLSRFWIAVTAVTAEAAVLAERGRVDAVASLTVVETHPRSGLERPAGVALISDTPERPHHGRSAHRCAHTTRIRPFRATKSSTCRLTSKSAGWTDAARYRIPPVASSGRGGGGELWLTYSRTPTQTICLIYDLLTTGIPTIAFGRCRGRATVGDAKPDDFMGVLDGVIRGRTSHQQHHHAQPAPGEAH